MNGVTEETPFLKQPNILVFKVLGKIFTTTDIDTFANFSIKCNPETIDELRATYPSVIPPSYFNKKHWSKVLLDGTISDKMLYHFLDLSYELVVAQLPKKERLRLKSEKQKLSE